MYYFNFYGRNLIVTHYLYDFRSDFFPTELDFFLFLWENSYDTTLDLQVYVNFFSIEL